MVMGFSPSAVMRLHFNGRAGRAAFTIILTRALSIAVSTDHRPEPNHRPIRDTRGGAGMAAHQNHGVIRRAVADLPKRTRFLEDPRRCKHPQPQLPATCR